MPSSAQAIVSVDLPAPLMPAISAPASRGPARAACSGSGPRAPSSRSSGGRRRAPRSAPGTGVEVGDVHHGDPLRQVGHRDRCCASLRLPGSPPPRAGRSARPRRRESRSMAARAARCRSAALSKTSIVRGRSRGAGPRGVRTTHRARPPASRRRSAAGRGSGDRDRRSCQPRRLRGARRGRTQVLELPLGWGRRSRAGGNGHQDACLLGHPVASTSWIGSRRK